MAGEAAARLSLTEAIATSELFGALDAAELQRVSERAVEKTARAGEWLFRVGDEADALYLLADGKVELTFPLVVIGERKDVRFQTLEPGRAIAWSALVPPHKLTMSARAATDVRLIVLRRDKLLPLFVEQPRIGLAALSSLTRVIGSRLLEVQALWVREVQRNVSHVYR